MTALICDIDGVILHDGLPLPGASRLSEDTWMVGDNMETDIIAGVQTGLTTVLVLQAPPHPIPGGRALEWIL